ncbi:MAG: CNNM domain-containing protein [Planctomycetota bacterium]|jgi:CBS domain containing-hemolysin-like protein
MINNILVILLIFFAVIFSGLFAGAETGIYQLSRLRLRLGIEKKRFSFIILGKIMRDSGALLISILIGNNLTYYITTSIVTLLLLGKFENEHTVELLATVLTAPVLFVFAELIPKNIFFYRANVLMPYVAPVLFVFKKLSTWCGILPLLKSIARLFARLAGSSATFRTAITTVPQSHIRAILRDTQEEGILSSTQTDIINRLSSISNLSIKSVMTGISKTQTVDINSDNSSLLNKLRKSVFTRLPVYEQTPTKITGFINIYDCLSSSEQFTDLRNFIKPIRKLAAETIVSDAMNIMQSESQKIVLVVRTAHSGRERPVGIVTMKDLVEELLGELSEW